MVNNIEINFIEYCHYKTECESSKRGESTDKIHEHSAGTTNTRSPSSCAYLKLWTKTRNRVKL